MVLKLKQSQVIDETDSTKDIDDIHTLMKIAIQI
jgi:hypothetical protein